MKLPNRRTSVTIATVAVFCATLAVLLPAMPWRVWTGDTAEAQTVPYILGIAHPTGFPAYTLLGWVFSHVFAFGTVAWRLNLFTASCVALTSAGVVLLAAALGSNAFAAAIAGLAFAFGSSIRGEAVLANAQGLAGTCIVFALLAAVIYARAGRPPALIASCACAGLGLATHPAAIWVLPGIAVAVAWQWRAVTRRTAAIALLVLAAPVLLYLYLPARSAIVAAQHLDPTAAAPLFGAGTLDWDTNHPRTLGGFLDEVLGRQLKAGAFAARVFIPGRIPAVAAFWLQFAERQYGIWLLLVAGAGAVALAQRDRRSLSVVFAGVCGGISFVFAYRYDSQLSWYLLPSFAAIAALAAASTRIVLPRMNAAVISGGVSILLAVAAVTGRIDQPRTRDLTRLPGGTGIIANVAASVPDGAIVVASWYEAAALGYASAVEHSLGSRTIVAALPAQYVDRYPQWTRNRRVVIYAGGREFDASDYVRSNGFRELPTADPFYHVIDVVPVRSRSEKN